MVAKNNFDGEVARFVEILFCSKCHCVRAQFS